MFNLSLKTNTLLPVVWVYASYGSHTYVNSLEGCLLCYHYTNDAEKAYDRRNKFINFRILFFPYKFSEGHIKKTKTNLWEVE